MLAQQAFDEIHVYAGIAERTGVRFERNEVRRSGGYCRSMTELIGKARASGDGLYFLPPDSWPADTERVELRKQWVVIPSIPRAARASVTNGKAGRLSVAGLPARES